MADADLPIQSGQQCLDVHDHCLDLHDEQRLITPMPREQVNAASLAEVIERSLRFHSPTVPLEQGGPIGLKPCMVRIQQSMQVTAGQAEIHAERRTDRSGGGRERSYRVPADQTALEIGEDPPADARAPGDIFLSQLVSMPHGAQSAPDELMSHGSRSTARCGVGRRPWPETAGRRRRARFPHRCSHDRRRGLPAAYQRVQLRSGCRGAVSFGALPGALQPRVQGC